MFREFLVLRKRVSREPIKLEHATFDATVSEREGASLVNEIFFYEDSPKQHRFGDFALHFVPPHMCILCIARLNSSVVVEAAAASKNEE